MGLTPEEISMAFSSGKFEHIYSHFAEDIVWDVIGENMFHGKKAVVDNCEQVASYFRSVETNFKTKHVIVDTNKVVVSGTAEFSKDGKVTAFVSACDVYEFSESDELKTICSYCIPVEHSK